MAHGSGQSTSSSTLLQDRFDIQEQPKSKSHDLLPAHMNPKGEDHHKNMYGNALPSTVSTGNISMVS